MPSHYQAQDLEKERGEVQRSGAWLLRLVVPFQNQQEQFTAIALRLKKHPLQMKHRISDSENHP